MGIYYVPYFNKENNTISMKNLSQKDVKILVDRYFDQYGEMPKKVLLNKVSEHLSEEFVRIVPEIEVEICSGGICSWEVYFERDEDWDVIKMGLVEKKIKRRYARRNNESRNIASK